MIQGLQATHPDVDAIVCLPEGLGVGILSTLRELGHSVPDDIQLVSYTDSPTLPIVQPPISALDLRAKDAGMRAGELLISLIEGADGAEHTIEWFDLIYRERVVHPPDQEVGQPCRSCLRFPPSEPGRVSGQRSSTTC